MELTISASLIVSSFFRSSVLDLLYRAPLPSFSTLMLALRAPSVARMTTSMHSVARRAPAQARALPRLPARRTMTVAVASNKNDDKAATNTKQAATLAAAAFAAATLFLVPVDAAEAARSGGRVGGSSGFRSAPRSSAPRSK